VADDTVRDKTQPSPFSFCKNLQGATLHSGELLHPLLDLRSMIVLALLMSELKNLMLCHNFMALDCSTGVHN
jgi:hypothetical protein